IIGNPSLNHRYRKGFYSLFKTLQQNRNKKIESLIWQRVEKYAKLWSPRDNPETDDRYILLVVKQSK
ncbi:hypothetical protein SJ619_13560, partial [Enterococcus faecium]